MASLSRVGDEYGKMFPSSPELADALDGYFPIRRLDERWKRRPGDVRGLVGDDVSEEPP